MDVISLNSFVTVLVWMVSFRSFISVLVSEIVSLQHCAVSFISSHDKLLIFSYHLFMKSAL